MEKVLERIVGKYQKYYKLFQRCLFSRNNNPSYHRLKRNCNVKKFAFENWQLSRSPENSINIANVSLL